MNSQEIITVLKRCSLFYDFTDSEMINLSKFFIRKDLALGSFLFHEEQHSDCFFVIMSGRVDVIKHDKITKTSHKISTLKQSDVTGELGIIGKRTRSASIKASTDVVVLEMKYEDLKNFLHENHHLESKFYIKLGEIIDQRLRTINQKSVKFFQLQIETAQFCLSLNIITIILILVLDFIAKLASKTHYTTFLTVGFLFFLFILTTFCLKQSKLPLSTYGLSIFNIKRSIIRGTLYTIPILFLLCILKYIAIQFIPMYSGNPIFDFAPYSSDSTLLQYVLIVLTYAIGVPMQEFIIRGGIQGSLQAFWIGKYKKHIAIFMGTLIFSLGHVPISKPLALAVIPFSIFWGWLFSKHRSLVTVSTSHILIGVFAFNVLNFAKIMLVK